MSSIPLHRKESAVRDFAPPDSVVMAAQ